MRRLHSLWGQRDFARFTEAALALVLIVVLSPLLMVCWVLTRLTFGQPAIFRQRRVGHKGRPFEILKFRTIQNGVDQDLSRHRRKGWAASLGTFMRMTSLDELPQLFNILRGDMGFIGPRPLMKRDLIGTADDLHLRQSVRPGLTGLAQIKGRNALMPNDKLAFDLWYLRNRSLWLDLRIILQTVPTVLSQRGIFGPGGGLDPRPTTNGNSAGSPAENGT